MSKTQPPPAPDMGTIRLEEIRTDGGTQCRVVTDEEVINEYVEALKAGRIFPPVTVFSDMHGVFWLADGHHRYAAHQRAGFNHIQAHIHRGSQRDAQLHSIGANAENGLRRSNLDKRNAVLKLLRDEEWSRLPVRRMAEIARVSDAMIVKVRQAVNAGSIDIEGRKLIPAPSASLATYADCDAAALEHAVERCADPLTLAALLSAPALTREQRDKLTAMRASLEALYAAKPGQAWVKAAWDLLPEDNILHPTRGMTQGKRAAMQITRRKWATRQGASHEVPTMHEIRQQYSTSIGCLDALQWGPLDDDATATAVLLWKECVDFEREIKTPTTATWAVSRFVEGSDSGHMPALRARAAEVLEELRAKAKAAPAQPAKPNLHAVVAEIIAAPDYPQRVEALDSTEVLTLLFQRVWEKPDRYGAAPPERARALRPLIRARLVALGVPIQTCPDLRCEGAETVAHPEGSRSAALCSRCYNAPGWAKEGYARDIAAAMELLRLVGSRPAMSVLRGAAAHPAGIIAGMQAAPAEALAETAAWLLQIEVSDVG